ncbi:MAG TPA: TMEM175 family protein [Thermoleophilaceae bacterium]
MDNRFESARTEAFSDGVFAIAITLLVLEISVPKSEFHDLWRGIANQWPSYLSYITSFMTIGGLWLVHHAIFRRLVNADTVVIRLNLLLLMAVSFLPFPTKLMAEALHQHAGERQAVLFYGAVLFVITSLITAMARYAAREHLVEDNVTREELQALVNRTAPSAGFFGGVTLLAFFAPTVAVFGFLVVAVQAILRTR